MQVPRLWSSTELFLSELPKLQTLLETLGWENILSTVWVQEGGEEQCRLRQHHPRKITPNARAPAAHGMSKAFGEDLYRGITELSNGRRTDVPIDGVRCG